MRQESPVVDARPQKPPRTIDGEPVKVHFRQCPVQYYVRAYIFTPLYCTIAHRTAVHHFHATLERALRRRPTVSASVGCSVIRVGNAPPQGEGWTCAVHPLVSQVLCSLTLQLGMVVMVL